MILSVFPFFRRSKKQAKKLNSTTNIANSPIPVELAINKKAASPGRKIPKLRGENTPESKLKAIFWKIFFSFYLFFVQTKT